MNPTLLRRLVMVLCLVVSVAGWPGGPAAVFGQADDGDSPDAQSPDARADSDAVAKQTPRPSVQSLPVGATLAIIPVQDEIYGFTKDSIERRVDRAIAGGADLIVFDFDTPGGVLVPALEIASYINTIPVPTVGWVNRKALSAGILLASACDEIVMARSSLTGDCAPIIPGHELAPTERAKVLSPLLEAFRANADENHGGPSGSDYALFHAMCALGVEVYQVRHKDTGEVRLVNAVDYAVMVSGQSPDDFNGPGGGPAGGITPGASAINRPDEATTVAAASLHLAGYDDQGQWELVRKVHDGNTLLTLTEKRALEIGLSKATVSNEAELMKLYGAGTILQVNQTWSENLAGFFIHPVVRGVLMLVFIIGLLLEYFSPGLIIPSVVAFTALGILIGAPFVVGLAQVWHVLLLVIGIGLIIIELIATPTFGVLGIVGVLMMLTGFVLSVVPTGGGALPAQGTSKQIISASMSMVVAFVLTIPAFIILTRYFGALPLFNKLILVDEQGTNLRNQAGEKIDKPYTRLSGDEAVGSGTITVGMTGTVTATGLRPSGRVEIHERLIDVTSPGTWIEPGTAVRVAEVHGNVIVVEPVEDA